ncbi:MAG: hypothetical protein FWG30_06800 [Eubacteriaceae bacterium]|nr:hypothetical protein [Eubacteriaceae bacterium]
MSKKSAAIIIAGILICIFACSCLMGFTKLKIGSPSQLLHDVNSFLSSAYSFTMDEFTKQPDIGYKELYVSATKNGVYLTLSKDKANIERVGVEMAPGKGTEEEAAAEFGALMSSVINRFSGFEYIHPVANSLFQDGSTIDSAYQASYSVGEIAYNFTIDSVNGFIFSASSL